MSGRRRLALNDQTIPVKVSPPGNAAQRTETTGPREGWLVDYGTTVVLTDRDGNAWPEERVRYVCGFGSNDEGAMKRPRPFKYNPDGSTLIEGDMLLIDFLRGNPQLPVITGGVRTLKPSDPDFFAAQDVGEDPNPIRMRAHIQNPRTGVVTGTLQLRALDGGTQLEVILGGATFGKGLRLLIDYGAGTISLDKQGITHPVPLGDELVTRVQQIAQDLIAINAALPTLSPVPTLNAFQIAIDAAQSLSTGAPLLSSIVKVQ